MHAHAPSPPTPNRTRHSTGPLLVPLLKRCETNNRLGSAPRVTVIQSTLQRRQLKCLPDAAAHTVVDDGVSKRSPSINSHSTLFGCTTPVPGALAQRLQGLASNRRTDSSFSTHTCFDAISDALIPVHHESSDKLTSTRRTVEQAQLARVLKYYAMCCPQICKYLPARPPQGSSAQQEWSDGSHSTLQTQMRPAC